MLLALVEHPDFARRDLSSLRSVSGEGRWCPPSSSRDIEATLGVQFTVVFGQTEACGFISQTHLDDTAEDKGATLGDPLPGRRGARRRPRHRRPGAPAGVVGELEVRGPNVMSGYHGLPEETAAAHRGPTGGCAPATS